MEVNKQAHHIFVGKPRTGKPPRKGQAPNTGNESAGIIVADLVTTDFSKPISPPVLPQAPANDQTQAKATEAKLPKMALPVPKFDLTDSSNLQSLNNGNLTASPTVIAAVPYDTPEIQWLTDVIDKTPKPETQIPSVPADTPEIQWLTQGTGLKAEEPVLAELVTSPEEPILAEVVRYTDPDLPEIEYLTEWLSKPVSEDIQWGKSQGIDEPIIAEVVREK